LVADLGGTRCDATAVTSCGRTCAILETACGYALGGLKLDEVLVDHVSILSKEFITKHKVDARNERPLAELRLEAGG